jgi:hypothetical protein
LDNWLLERYRIPAPVESRGKNGSSAEPIKGDSGGRD